MDFIEFLRNLKFDYANGPHSKFFQIDMVLIFNFHQGLPGNLKIKPLQSTHSGRMQHIDCGGISHGTAMALGWRNRSRATAAMVMCMHVRIGLCVHLIIEPPTPLHPQ